MKAYVHDFMWVNAGEWRNQSSVAAAIDQAESMAFRAECFGKIQEVHVVRMECEDGHIDICDHLRVTLIFKEY